ncbi:nucleotidyl transferase AbiEii/AbiGii toxin family protein [Allomuricauda sp. ARW1Y1]|jgi:predicted nucleotidyltransferase component of viral defense system|uniref:nucleotidyl transferase AbiEii/AbiGii toxin family protein n=1 Tax=Allomuricauda sp. ARW1Y1 TaxID=2663843 RepID=UPI0015CED0E2|nr:nucleotidyl transferase AbiEii/AbiGii toxin family protein [Muricauda sp. ARW1Y1]NYJ28208.1 putative nucleotidyltransferase component of viral defense system [Muricauda sp. ARW1Y1]
MLFKREIEKYAEANGVLKSTIDKDWVLGHFIDSIFSIPKCREALVFKGGTCLRKCYFPDYRFSEDLDFTSINPEFALDKKMLKEIARLITKRSEIPLHIQELSPLRFNEKLTGYKATIKFWGADHSRNQAPPVPERWTTSIKIEIILFEKLVFPFEMRKVHHPYSDVLSSEPLSVPCYSLNEVLAEKLRALIQRSYTAPRDFYDIWYLSKNVPNIEWTAVTKAFHEKMAFKDLAFTGINQMLNDDSHKALIAAWSNSLQHQIPEKNMVEYATVKNDIAALLKEIF